MLLAGLQHFEPESVELSLKWKCVAVLGLGKRLKGVWLTRVQHQQHGAFWKFFHSASLTAALPPRYLHTDVVPAKCHGGNDFTGLLVDITPLHQSLRSVRYKHLAASLANTKLF